MPACVRSCKSSRKPRHFDGRCSTTPSQGNCRISNRPTAMNLLNEAKLRQLGVSRLSARGITRFAANAEMLKESRELGYVDGYRERVAIFPIAQGTATATTYNGQAYFGIY